MFSSIKMEEYMEPQLPGIFWVKMVAKNIVLECLRPILSMWRLGIILCCIAYFEELFIEE